VSEEIQRLEEKIAYLEHHVTQQDKAMLELSESLERMKRELALMALRMSQVAENRGGDGSSPHDERPPHY